MSTALRPAYLVHALRTPIGKHRGGLSPVRADDLAAHLIATLAQRAPSLVARVDHVVFGATNQAGEDNPTSLVWRCCSPACRTKCRPPP
jgi:acetyl-CoA acyltransferase